MISKEDISYLHNISEADKIKLFLEVTFYTNLDASQFSLDYIGRMMFYPQIILSRKGIARKGNARQLNKRDSTINRKY